MPTPPKIVTCCYCGTRAALVLAGCNRHELSCSACGAPLHDLKMLPSAAMQKAEKKAGKAEKKAAKKARKAGAMGQGAAWPLPHPGKPPSSKKAKYAKPRRKGLFSRVLDEAWDAVEDIFD